MTRFAFPPPPPPALPVAGSDLLYPVRRIWCIGRNYAAHAREMGSDPAREAPFWFAKPADALVPLPPERIVELPYPRATENLHHEIELVVAIGRGGEDIAAADALGHVWGYAVGFDLTRRDLQNAAKASGRPWEPGKAFDASAPVGALQPVARCGHPAKGEIRLDVNRETRQRGDLADMILPVAEAIADLSRLVRLEPGDLLFTGTPEGVGPLVAGDLLHGRIEGVGEAALRIVPRAA